MAEFYIRQGASQPVLFMELNRNNVFTYEKFQKALENCAISFSMIDVETGKYQVAKKLGGIILKPTYDTEVIPIDQYYIYYKFSNLDTNKPGRYRAEFKIDFFDTISTDITGTFIAPVQDDLFINVKKSLFTDINSNGKIINQIFSSEYNNIFS